MQVYLVFLMVSRHSTCMILNKIFCLATQWTCPQVCSICFLFGLHVEWRLKFWHLLPHVDLIIYQCCCEHYKHHTFKRWNGPYHLWVKMIRTVGKNFVILNSLAIFLVIKSRPFIWLGSFHPFYFEDPEFKSHSGY